MVICSAATGEMHEAQLKIMKPTVEAYGKKHNIDTIFFTKRFDPSRPASWDKIIILNNLLKHYEIAMWIDADAIFLDIKEDIRNELDNKHVMFMVTHNFRDPIWPNGGIMVVKRENKTFHLLEEIWNKTQAIDHIWWEQQAIFNVLGYENRYHQVLSYSGPNEFSDLIGFLDLKWNSRPIDNDVADNPIIMHYCGLPNEIRISQMLSCYRIFQNNMKKSK